MITHKQYPNHHIFETEIGGRTFTVETGKVAELAGEDEETVNLSRKLLASGDFTQASALAFLVFILLYFPCIATIAAIGAEAGWKWATAAVAYNTVLAWVVAWAVYRLFMWL